MKSVDSAHRSAMERRLEVLTKENEALRTVLARLHQDNLRLEETLLKARRRRSTDAPFEEKR